MIDFINAKIKIIVLINAQKAILKKIKFVRNVILYVKQKEIIIVIFARVVLMDII